MVDVTGTSKGKGTQGVIKRWNQSRGPMGHGSQYHRGVGSLGTMLPKRVLPGKDSERNNHGWSGRWLYNN